MLCIVILALLVPAWLSHVRAPRGRLTGRGSRPAVAVPSGAAPVTRGHDSLALAHATPAPAAAAPAASSRPAAAPRVRAQRGTRRATRPTHAPDVATDPAPTTPAGPTPVGNGAVPLPPKATESAGNFTVFSVGDEELAPLTTFEGPRGIMLPLSDVASLLGATIVVRDGMLNLQMQADDPVQATVSITTLRGTRRAHGTMQVITLPDSELVQRDGQWYATIEALRTLSALEMSFDTRSQSVVITSPRAMIPRYAAGMRRLQRESRARAEAQDQLVSSKPAVNARIARGSFLPRMAALTYSVSQDNMTGAWSGQGTLGAAFLGGGLSVTGSTWTGRSTRVTPDVTWLGGDPLSRFITQARVGYGASTGMAPLPGYGVALSNAPFSRPMGLGSVPMRGTAAPGAEIEIQSGGRLLGVVTADNNGQWQLPVPVGFGQNLLEISTYTPLGVTRRTELVSIDGDHIPGGKFEYGITAQRTRRDDATCAALPCGDMGNFDLRWGVTPRLTLRGGASALLPFDSAGGATTATLYGGIAAAPTSWLQLRYEQAGTTWSAMRGVVQPSLALRAEVGREQFSGPIGAAPFWQQNKARNTRAESWTSLTWRPIRSDLSRLWFSVIGRSVNGTRLASQQASAVIGGRVSGALFTIGADHTAVTPIGTREAIALSHLTGSVTIPQLRRGPAWLASSFVTLGASMKAQDDRTPTWSAGITTIFRRSLMMQLGTEWRPGAPPSLRLQFQQHSRAALFMQSFATAAAGRSEIAGSTSVLGSLLVPFDGRAPSLTSDLVALRARVRVIAFLDADGNGLKDASEATIPELPLRVGTQRTLTDPYGVALVEGLQVLDAIPVRPEQGTVADVDGMNWTMSGPAPWARLVPYGETVVWLPYVRTAGATVLFDPDYARSTLSLTLLDDATLFDIPRRPLDESTIEIGPTRPGRYRIEARHGGEDGSATPWGRCILTLDARDALRIRIPVSTGLDDVPCTKDSAVSKP